MTYFPAIKQAIANRIKLDQQIIKRFSGIKMTRGLLAKLKDKIINFF